MLSIWLSAWLLGREVRMQGQLESDLPRPTC